MGIKGLWTILLPFAERISLYQLEGKIVAVDLAGWVCDSSNVVDYYVQPNIYLRNLFYRVCYLLLCGVNPVFVLEGKAPKLKYKTMSERNEIQFIGNKPRTQTENNKTDSDKIKIRSRFNFVLKQCEDLLNTMGLQCLQADGEAEAFCSQLNIYGLVDGVISQDSDCFGYGAKKVYRNFSISDGSVDVYDLDIIKKSMDIGQNKAIVLGLLCGCDYTVGISGVGRDSVIKLFNRYKNDTILDEIKMWRNKAKYYSSLEIKVDDKNICVNCGHSGRVQEHGKKGCINCKIYKGCDATLWKEERLSIKAELQIRKHALAEQDFPSQEIIDEFLKRPDKIPHMNLKWKKPNVVKFLRKISKLLQWNEIYCFQKFLPLLTRWQLLHHNNNDHLPLKEIVYPEYIKKKRKPKGLLSYEIIWKDQQKFFDLLIPDDQIKTFLEQNPNGIESLWSTIEPIDLVENAFPEIVSKFNELKSNKNKKPIKRILTKTPKKSKKTKLQKNTPTNINKYLKRGIEITQQNIIANNEKENVSPKEITDSMIDFSISEVNPNNISIQIMNIIKQQPQTSYFKGKQLHFDEVQPILNTPKEKLFNGSTKNILNDSIDNINDSFGNLSLNNNNSTPILVKRFFERNNITPK